MKNNVNGKSIILPSGFVEELAPAENYVSAESGRVRTGSRARQQLTDVLRNLAKKIDPGEDEFYPQAGRRERRMADRRETRDRRRAQRNYTRREWQREQVVGDLRQQFAIIDGLVPVRGDVVERVKRTLQDKAQTLLDQDVARYTADWQKVVREYRAEHGEESIVPSEAFKDIPKPMFGTVEGALGHLRLLAAGQ